MLSINTIERGLREGCFQVVIERILRNGRQDLSRPAAQWTEPRLRRVAAMSLALQRVLELSYGVPEVAMELVQSLVVEWSRWGSLLSRSHRSRRGEIGATALWVRALRDFAAAGKSEGVSIAALSAQAVSCADALEEELVQACEHADGIGELDAQVVNSQLGRIPTCMRALSIQRPREVLRGSPVLPEAGESQDLALAPAA